MQPMTEGEMRQGAMKNTNIARRLAVLFSTMAITAFLFGCGQVPTAVEADQLQLQGMDVPAEPADNDTPTWH